MRIYLDGMLFLHAGIGRIYQNLLQGLAGSPEVSRIHTLIPRARKDDFLRKYPNDKIEAVFTDLPFDYREYFGKGPLIRKFRPEPRILRSFVTITALRRWRSTKTARYRGRT